MDFSLAKTHQALLLWKLSGNFCIPHCLYRLAGIGSNTQTSFGWDVGGQESPFFFLLFEEILAAKPSHYFWQMYVLPKQKA